MLQDYVIDYETPRYDKKLSRNDVVMLLADRGIDISTESLGCYERGVREPSPDMVLELSEVYKEPFMTQKYCKYNCSIGKAYSYEILDGLNLDNISNIALKLLEEHRESQNVLNDVLGLIVNKESEKDFTGTEKDKLKEYVHELLDTEHTIEIFKIALNKFLDMKEVIKEHNEKCIEKGYANKKAFQSWNSKRLNKNFEINLLT